MKTKASDPINPAKLKGSNPYNSTEVNGLTKREYFASQAQMALLAGRAFEPYNYKDIATCALVHADTLISWLNEREVPHAQQ